MIYLIPILLTLIGVVVYDYKQVASFRGVWVGVSWLSLVLIAGLRYQVGGDTLTYMSDFQYIIVPLQDLTWDLIVENYYNVLWVVFNSACKSIWDDFTMVQLVHAVVVNSAVVYFFARHTKHIFTALFFYTVCFFLFYNTEIMRASLAMAVFLFGFSTLEKKQWLRYLLVMVIAYGFHSEALVMLLFPVCHLLGRVHINIRTVSLLAGIAVAMMGLLVFLPYVATLLHLTERFAVFSHYIEYQSRLNIFGKMQYLALLVPWVLVLFMNKKTEYPLLRGMLVLFLMLSLPMLEYQVLFTRVTDFLKPACVVCLANGIWYVYGHKERALRIVGVLAIAGVLVVAVRDQLAGESGYEFYRRYFPYHHYWDSKTLDDKERQDMMNNVIIF